MTKRQTGEQSHRLTHILAANANTHTHFISTLCSVMCRRSALLFLWLLDSTETIFLRNRGQQQTYDKPEIWDSLSREPVAASISSDKILTLGDAAEMDRMFSQRVEEGSARSSDEFKLGQADVVWDEWLVKSQSEGVRATSDMVNHANTGNAERQGGATNRATKHTLSGHQRRVQCSGSKMHEMHVSCISNMNSEQRVVSSFEKRSIPIFTLVVRVTRFNVVY